MIARLAGAIAVVPVLALVVLIATGAASPGPALATIAAVTLSAVWLARRALRDLDRFRRRLRRSEPAGGTPRPGLAAGLSPLLVDLAEEIESLLREFEDRAARAASRLESEAAIVQLLPDPLIVLGADRSVVLANAAARAAFGGDMAAVLRHPALHTAINRAAAEGTGQRAELALPAPVPRELDVAAIPLGPGAVEIGAGANRLRATNRLGGYRLMVVLSDRTRERVIERMREDFVANASHELRTPLATLTGFIETLRGPAADDPPAQQKFLAIMADEAARMNRLIDDLLSLSRIQLTEHRPPAERVSLAGLIEGIAAAFEPQLAAGGATLALSVAADLPEVRGDADQLTQVLQNLLDNALKYGAGAIRLSAAIAGPGRWPARPGVVIAVADNGPGIPREHIPRLTERFYRVDKGRSRRAGGTGLGLAIVKHIVNRHRGHLFIDSEEGRGSTFSIWLPAE